MAKTKERAGMRVAIAEREYVIFADEITGRDVRDFRAEVGMSPMRVFRDTSLLDLDVIAGLVWLVRRRTKPTLTYDEVLDGISYANMELRLDGGDGDGEDGDPEA